MGKLPYGPVDPRFTNMGREKASPVPAPMPAIAPQKPPPASSSIERQRITVDVPPSTAALLDYYCDATGQARSAVILGLLTAHLPAMLDLADNLKKRAGQLPPIKR